MDRRRFVGSIAGGLLAVPLAARAQQSAKIPRVGYVSGTGSATDQGPYVEALRRGLRDLGQIEGGDFSAGTIYYVSASLGNNLNSRG